MPETENFVYLSMKVLFCFGNEEFAQMNSVLYALVTNKQKEVKDELWKIFSFKCSNYVRKEEDEFLVSFMICEGSSLAGKALKTQITLN